MGDLSLKQVKVIMKQHSYVICTICGHFRGGTPFHRIANSPRLQPRKYSDPTCQKEILISISTI